MRHWWRHWRAKSQPADGDGKFWCERLHYLLDYNDASELFDSGETESLVRAIAEIKILDPAVGSGAFPYGCAAQADSGSAPPRSGKQVVGEAAKGTSWTTRHCCFWIPAINWNAPPN